MESNNPIKNFIDSLDTNPSQKRNNEDNLDSILAPVKLSEQGAYKLGEYKVPIGELYTPLSDGTLIAKYDKYYAPSGNENQNAIRQTWSEKAFGGLAKNVTKAGVYALDGLVGIPIGVVEAIKTGSFKNFSDNDFANSLDDFNKRLDYALPNYYSDEEKAKSLLGQLGTINFWANDFAGGLAFVGGTLLSGAALGLITGGASFGATLSRLGFRAGTMGAFKALSKEGLEKLAKESIEQGIKSQANRAYLRGLSWAQKGKTVGDVLDTGSFLLRSSAYEAGMESRQNLRESVDTYIMTFAEKNGRLPNPEEVSKFTKLASDASIGVFTANMVILGISNAAFYGRMFGLGGLTRSAETSLNKLIGIGYQTEAATGRIVLQNANRFQRTLGTTAKILSGPLWEGVFEEGLQGVAGKSMQKYLEDKYDPRSSRRADDMWSYWTESMADQYSSKDGQKEILIGMLIGFAGGKLHGGGFSGLGKNNYSAERANLYERIDLANKRRESLLQRMTQASYTDRAKDNTPELADVDTALGFINASEAFQTTSEIKSQFNTILETTELTQDQLKELEKQGITVEEFKAKKVSDFNQLVEDYNFAKDSADALVSDNLSAANLGTLRDAYIRTVMFGRNAERYGNQTLNEFNEETGFNTEIFSFFSNLNDTQRQKVNELEEKKEQKENNLREVERIGFEISQLQAQQLPEEQKKAELEKKQRQHFLLNQEIARLSTEVTNLEESLELEIKASSNPFSVFGADVSKGYSIGQALEEVKKFNNYVEALKKTGDNSKAEKIEKLLYDFRIYSDMNREFVNAAANMIKTDFFNTTQGKGLLNKLMGPKYEMSEEFRQMVLTNNEVFDEIIGQIFEERTDRSQETIDQEIENLLNNNPLLSDRDKYRLESLMRMALTRYAPYTPSISVEQFEEEEIDPLEGDTITLNKPLSTDPTKSNLEILQEAIDAITAQIDFLQETDPNKQAKIKQLEQELADLKEQLDEAMSGRGEKTAEEAPTTQSEIEAKKADIERRRQEKYNAQDKAINSGQVLDNQGDPVYTEDGGIGANGLSTLTDKEYGHGHTRTSGLNSLKVLESLLGGSVFSGMFGKIKKKANETTPYTTWESGTFIIVSNNSNPITGNKLNLNEVEIILNAGLTPFAQELANKYPNVVIKDFNGKKYDAELKALEQQTATSQTTTTRTDFLQNKIDQLEQQKTELEEKKKRGERVEPIEIKSISLEISRLKAEIESKPVVAEDLPKELAEKVTTVVLNGVEQTMFTANQGVDRPAIFLNIGGKIIGFYRSSKGTDGKIEGNWYPFYGATNGWVVKDGGGKNWRYNAFATPEVQQQIKEGAELLNKYFGAGKTIPEIPTLNFESIRDYNTQIGSPLALLPDATVEQIGVTQGEVAEYDTVLKQVSEEGFKPILKQTTTNQQITDESTQQTPTQEELQTKIQELTIKLEELKQQSISELKSKQLEIIENTNPAPNEANTWVRVVEDIKTAEEAFSVAKEEGAMYPDFTEEDMDKALEKGEVKVYSSQPIKDGVFVTPSKMNAQEYAGGKKGKVYSKTVKLKDVAWIDEGEGQYAKTSEDETTQQILDLQNEIDQLQKQLEDATKNDQEQKQEDTEQSGQREYQGTNESQQDQGQTEEQKTDNSDSVIEDLQKQIAEVEAKLSEAKQPYRVIESQDYIRINELITAQNERELTPEEQEELAQLRRDLDTWTVISGAVVKGVKLSDLIEQKIALEKAQINRPDLVEVVEGNEVAEAILEEENVNSKVYYENAQTHDAVTIGFKKEANKVVITGIKEKDIPQIFTRLDETGTVVPISFQYSVDDKGNILIDLEELSKFEEPDSLIMIRPGDAEIPGNYSILYVSELRPNGQREWKKLDSSYNDYANPQTPTEIYEIEEGEDLSLVIDMRDNFNKNLAKEYREAKTKAEKEKVKKKIKQSLRINVLRGGTNVADLKQSGKSFKLNETDQRFISLREKIIDELFDVIIDKKTDKELVSSQKVKAKQVLVGHPNFLIERNAQGKFVFQYKDFTKEQAKTVLDIGIIQDGKITTRSGRTDTTINTTYIKKRKGKVPFIVIEKGNTRVAYPVRLKTERQIDTQPFIQLFESTLDPQRKVIELNKFLAENGIDIKEKGKAFYQIGQSNNLTEEFRDKMVKELENVSYFYPTTEWTKNNIPIEELLIQQAEINIDMSEPIHSPKLKMDLSGVSLISDFSDYTEEKVEETKAKSTEKGYTATVFNAATENKEENC
jgi:hypothetical protein